MTGDPAGRPSPGGSPETGPPGGDGPGTPSGRTYRVRHTTRYRYEPPVWASHTLAHLRPRTTPTQRVLGHDLSVSPPARRWSSTDAFGNGVDHLLVDTSHDTLEVTATSEVILRPPALPVGRWWDRPWPEVVEATATDSTPDGLEGRWCRLPSRHTPTGGAVAGFARDLFGTGRTLGEALGDLVTTIHREFRFDPSVTDVSTPVTEVLAHRHGVCQDFAHLTLAVLRSVGLGARYVSGYLETDPPPGSERLVGADASHAWVGVWLPGRGWVDLDPTNGLVSPDRHITVAWGRDYGDVAPLRGVVTGPPVTQHLEVAVDVVAVRPGTP